MDRLRKRREEEKEEEVKEAGNCEGCVEEMRCPRVRARTRTYARAHIGTRLKVYICIDSVYIIYQSLIFFLSLSN